MMRYFILLLILVPAVGSAESYNACDFTMTQYLSSSIHDLNPGSKARKQLEDFVRANDPKRSEASCRKNGLVDKEAVNQYNEDLHKNCLRRCDIIAPTKSSRKEQIVERRTFLGDFMKVAGDLAETLDNLNKRGLLDGASSDSCRLACDKANAYADLVFNTYSAGVEHGRSLCSGEDKKPAAPRSVK